MTSPADPQLEALCPYCRGKIRLPADPTVPNARCPRCNENVPVVLLEARASSAAQVVSQAQTDHTGATPAPKKPAPPPPPQEVRVKCKLCGTLVYAPRTQIGQRVKCPDCDTMNLVTEPPKAEKKVEVKLDELDSFQLLDGVDQPDRQSASSQQKWYMAKCPTCFSQFRLKVEYAGKQFQCPDCRTQFTAGQPPAEQPKSRPTVLLDDPYELKLSEPVERPPVDVDDLIGSTQQPLGRELQAAAGRGDLDSREKLRSLHDLVKGEKQKDGSKEASPEKGKPAGSAAAQEPRRPSTDGKSPAAREEPKQQSADEQAATVSKPWQQQETGAASDGDDTADGATDTPPRPAPPKRPWYRLTAQSMFFKKLLLTDLRTFASEGGLIGRWVFLALLIALSLWTGASWISSMQQDLALATGFVLIVQSIASALLILVCLVMIASTMLPIVISGGLEQSQVEDWPPFSVADWFFQIFYLINALALGALPTVILVPLDNVYVLAFFQWLLIVPIFPLAILSMLDEGSPFAPYAPGLWRLVSVYRGLWWRFTVVGYVMAAVGMLLGGLALYQGGLILAVLAGVGIASLIVIYARFLGRMALFMSEQSSPQESLDEYDD